MVLRRVKGNLMWLRFLLLYKSNWIIFRDRLLGCGRFSSYPAVFGLGWKFFLRHPISSIRWVAWLISHFTGRQYFVEKDQHH